MPAWACLQRQRGGRYLGSRGLGGGAVTLKPTCWIPRASPSPLAETVDGEALWCPSLRPFSCSLMPGLGSLLPGQRPYPCSSGLLHVFPDDAPPDCVPSCIQNRAQGTDVPILWLCLENRVDDFLSSTLSGEMRNPCLLQPQAPACPPFLG